MKRFSIFILFLAITLLISSGKSKRRFDMPYEVKTIVIDAGHGGKDPGTIGATSKEKNIALNIALKVGGYLEKYLPDVKVIYTRKTDNFIELYDRPVIANKANADLFVSVHVDAIGGKSTVEGTTTYVMGLDKNKKNLDVAMRENSVMKYEENLENYNGFDPESDESYIIFDLYQSAFRENSLKLAEQIQTQFEKRVGRKSRGVKHGPFWVLWATTMPSVLVETGYITNPSEEQYLNTEKGQALIASGIFRAIRDYKNQVESIKVEN